MFLLTPASKASAGARAATSEARGPLPEGLWPLLICPACQAAVRQQDDRFTCSTCSRSYGRVDGVWDFRRPDASAKPEMAAWTQHWNPQNQQTIWQRFFSLYRKVVFAPAIAHYVDTYLARTGTLVEAGAGTSETSLRIDKAGGQRTLVAVDLIVPVLRHCADVMDAAIAADVFHLPFAPDSIDGLWNVGVMEHFTDAEIDAMLREFHRVLKPGASLCLFWPGRDSVPQRLLDGVALVSNLLRSKRTDALRFHPDEISRLPSRAEGRRILERAGFHVDRVEAGGRTLFAFKVVIARKTRGFVPVPAPTGGGLS